MGEFTRVSSSGAGYQSKLGTKLVMGTPEYAAALARTLAFADDSEGQDVA